MNLWEANAAAYNESMEALLKKYENTKDSKEPARMFGYFSERLNTAHAFYSQNKERSLPYLVRFVEIAKAILSAPT